MHTTIYPWKEMCITPHHLQIVFGEFGQFIEQAHQ